MKAILQGYSEELQRHTLITHFFNPPRYMRLLELVPGERTDPEIIAFMHDYADRVLGKGVVRAKDTPNFIGNRIGIFGIMQLIKVMQEEGYRVEEVDAIFGPALGRPKSAVFRTLDLVGLDVLADVAKNLAERLPNDPQRQIYQLPSFMQKMIEKGLLGRKTGLGFYKAIEKNGGKTYLVFDYKTMDYRPQEEVAYDSLSLTRGIRDVRERVKAVANTDDRAGQLAWKSLSAMICYAADLVPEIADDIYSIDNAMKWASIGSWGRSRSGTPSASGRLRSVWSERARRSLGSSKIFSRSGTASISVKMQKSSTSTSQVAIRSSLRPKA